MSKTKKQKLRESIKVGDVVYVVANHDSSQLGLIKLEVHCGVVVRPAGKQLMIEIMVPYLENIIFEYVVNCHLTPEALVEAYMERFKSSVYVKNNWRIQFVYSGDKETVFYERR